MQPTTPMPSESRFDVTDLDRRTWPRFPRRIRVLMLPDDCALEEPYGGWILNGSRGGVCLMVHLGAVEEGTVLKLRKPQAAAGTPWVAVRVKSRRQTEEGWELGCEFVRPLLHETAVLFH